MPFLLALLLFVTLPLLVAAYMWLGNTLVRPDTSWGSWLVAMGSFLAALVTIAWGHAHLADRRRRR